MQTDELTKSAAASRQELVELCDMIVNGANGEINKQASATATEVTRTTIREMGIQRQVMPFQSITNADLDYFGDHELPGKWYELEPDSPPARGIPYGSSPNTQSYSAGKYCVVFCKITTEELTKDINHLRTYRTDVRQIVTDNSLRDVHTAEDVAFFSEVDRNVGSQIALSTAPSIEVQNIAMGAGYNRDTIKRMQRFLTDRRQPLAINVMNRATANEVLSFDRASAGGDLSQELFQKGLNALGDGMELHGTKNLPTIKNDLILNGYVYQFSTPNFMGRALMLEDIQVIIKKEYDQIRLRAEEQVGLTFGNTRSFQKLQFTIGN